MAKLADLNARLMKDPEFAAAYAVADVEYRVIEEMIRTRSEAGLTQEALAERMGTTQSAIARLEGGRVSPSVETLRRYAVADVEYRVIEEMIRTRSEAGLTQEALAERMGTTQSAIARLEGGRVSPSVETLRRYAVAVGKTLRVEFV